MIEQLKTDLANTPAISWDQLPDLDLYLDQVVTYLSREQLSGCPEAELTPSMVNNYVKEGLLPRAVGKKYQREHLVYLRMINALKQVYNVKEIKDLLGHYARDKQPEEIYAGYLATLDGATKRVARHLEETDPASLAMQLAVLSYVAKLISKRLLEQLDDQAR